MRNKIMTLLAMLLPALMGWGETVLSTASSASVPANTTFVDGSSISSTMKIDYGPFSWDEGCVVTLNGTELLSSYKRGSYTWQPQRTGVNTLVWSSANVAITSKVNVASLTYAVAPTPNPPMSKVSTISITPTTRSFGVGGDGGAIITSGSGTWTAAVSDPWLTLSSTSGSAGTPVAYTVSATTNIGQRVGYVYVAGYTHTVTQDGYEAEVSPTEITAEKDGKTGTITLDSPGRYAWDAYPNNDWVSITPTHGVGSGTLTYQVAPYNEVSTRSGSFTVGGKTVNVFQYGRRMKLSQYSSSHDYFAHTIALTVNALAITTWSVTPNASWISVVDAGNGKGGDTVGLAIGENPSWKARTGTVTIGTETYTITQEGRTALEFKLNPTAATAAVTGGNGLLAVTATPDLPWTAQSQANWLTVLGNYVSGAGNGNIVYNASPNSTLSQRTGTIKVTPGDSSLNAKTLTVTQPAATASIDKSGYEFEAAGESVAVTVTVNDIVEWSISESLDWITVSGSTSRVGPGSVTISASANETIYPRSGTVRIAGKTFSVSQKARGVEVEYDSKVFGTDGGMESISIHPDGNVSWTAVASDSWIVIFQNASGTGDAEIQYILAPYEGDGSPRTGWITIGDKKVYVTQRAYDLDITPRAATVSGNNGAGEIGVSASIGDVWQAILCNTDWITIVTGYDAGTGSGTVRFTYTENNTGKTRTGKILISGEEYTLTQAARIPVSVTTSVEGHGGTVSGGGDYTLGDTVTLTATPDSGYEFLYWTGSAGETMQNPLRVTADAAKSFTAHFGPLTPEFTQVESSTEGVTLTWSALAWATQYKIYRAPTSEFPTVSLVTLQASAGSTYKDTTGEVGQSYFYWIEAIGADDTTECKDAASGMKKKPIVYSDITYTNLKGATHSNPATYQEGTLVSFTAPSAVAGYTFTGWTPSAITATMTGAQAVQANWTANSYTIAYNANGGTGTMSGTAATYDQKATIAANGFTYANHTFQGWATSAGGTVVYAAGAKVTNLTALQNGVVTLYAVWRIESYDVNGEQVEYGTQKTFTAPAPIVDGEGTTQIVCLGTSAYPEKGTNFVLTITGDLSFAWDLYQTNYWLEVEANDNVAVTLNGALFVDQWVAKDEVLDLVAVPDANYEVTGWYGDTAGCAADGATLSVTMTGPKVVGATVVYADPITACEGPVITPADGTTFDTATQTVTITCPTEGAAIYFTTNGVTPKTTASYRYTGAFTIGGTTTVKAIAVYTKANGETLKSGYVTATISYVEPQPPADPVITPADGAEFVGDSCTVTISCASEGATVYYSTTGSTPKTTDAYKYSAPFVITGTTTVKAVAVKNGLKSAYVTAVITKKTVTLADAVGAGALTFTTGGDAVWTIKTDASAKLDGMCVQSGSIADSQTTWIETTLSGAGTLSFWWKANCEDDPDGATWDHIAYSVDGVEKAFLDGVTGWTQVSVPLSEGAHTVRWTYSKDESDAEGEDCAYLDAVVWTPSGPQVIVATDPNGTITVPTSGEFTVKVMKDGHDITPYLDLPAAVGGVINLANATVKAAIAEEPLDTTKGAVVDLVGGSQGTASPTLKTAPTRPGLTYTLREGATLKRMADGVSKVGDGQPWTPNITVKGGTSGFYSIKVEK